MQNRLAALQGRLERRSIEEIGADWVGAKLAEKRLVRRRTGERPDVVTGGDESSDDGTTERAGRPGYEDGHF